MARPFSRLRVIQHHTQPQLSLLILALRQRAVQLRSLLADLLRQGRGRPIEIRVHEDDGQQLSGSKRQALRAAAEGQYVVFIDDDDQVAPQYLDRLLGALESAPDVVTFDLLQRHQRTGFAARWSLRLQLEDEPRDAQSPFVQLCANHLCAWRRELACRMAFPSIGYGDDRFWYHPLLASGLVQREVHLDEVLYYYDFDPRRTVNQQPRFWADTRRWAAGGVDSYRWQGQLVRAMAGRQLVEGMDPLPVMLPSGELRSVPRQQLEWFCWTKFQ